MVKMGSADQAALRQIADRMTWPSLHWGVEDVHPDAWPHIAIAAVKGARPVLRVEALQEALDLVRRCDDGSYDSPAFAYIEDVISNAIQEAQR